MNIYVGNLAFDINDDDLKKAFEVYGEVQTAKVIKDKFSGYSRGFGFVEMQNKTEAEKAISELDAKELKGRYLIVKEARPQSSQRKKNRRGGGGRHRY